MYIGVPEFVKEILIGIIDCQLQPQHTSANIDKFWVLKDSLKANNLKIFRMSRGKIDELFTLREFGIVKPYYKSNVSCILKLCVPTCVLK